MKKSFLAFLFTSLLISSCGQPQEPSPSQTLTVADTPAPTATLPSTETAVPSPTFTAEPGLFESAKALNLAPGLASRVAFQTTTPGDEAIISAIQNEEVFHIDGLYFDSISLLDEPEESLAYVLYDEPTGDLSVVALYDPNANHVIEMSTAYPLNVRSAPGIGIEIGPNGEEFYVYGFAWYPRWERILPQPLIELLEDFYSVGIEHVRVNMENYQEVVSIYGGALNLITWNESLLETLEDWGPNISGAPFMPLPDSGTVDISRVLFQDALDNGLIVIDELELDRYILSSYPPNSVYNTFQSRDAVVNKLLEPFRRPNRFSDLHKLIILGALYDDRGPLTLSIDFNLDGGFQVPDTVEKVVNVAPYEVDLMFGYDGIYFAKLLHELAHSVVSRDYRFISERCWPDEDEMVETFPYIMEYMWWVQQYPDNAPAWVWEPINSGLLLALLLDGTFQNFVC